MPDSPPTPRTTEELVAGLIEVQEGVSLEPFIRTANFITTDVCGQSGYSDGFVNSKMELIERWLAAHFYTIRDNQLAAAKAGTVSVTYQHETDLYLNASMYGQQALMLDTDGNLASLTNTAKVMRKINVKLLWMGRRRRYRCGWYYGC